MGDISLALCETCGFIQNSACVPDDFKYDSTYEESQAGSSRFMEYADALATDLVERHAIRGGRVTEIGCGKGDFLALLAERGNLYGVGIDPACDPGRHVSSPVAGRLRFLSERYSEHEHADLLGDLVCCRHTLEHIQDVRRFVESLRRGIGERTAIVVFFEVPDTYRILREQAFWDVYYEHCSYFTAGSLARLFEGCGFEVRAPTLAFGGQYLQIEARPAGQPKSGTANTGDLEDLRDAVAKFERGVSETLQYWRMWITERRASGESVAIWGGGSKAVAFLTSLRLSERDVRCVVDINPRKQGHYLAGTGHEVVAPTTLRNMAPDVVVVMNAIYKDEIAGDLRAMGLAPRIVTLDGGRDG